MSESTSNKKRGILTILLASICAFYVIHGFLMKGGGLLPALGCAVGFGGVVAIVYGALKLFRKRQIGWLAIVGGFVGLMIGGALLPSDPSTSPTTTQASSTSPQEVSASEDNRPNKPDHWDCLIKAQRADQSSPGTCTQDAVAGDYNSNPYCMEAHERAERYCSDHHDVTPY